jgi:ribosomal protein S18 acetylase RimI-like enzyme
MPFEIFTPESEADYAAARVLFREYASSLKVDLCFQNFELELANLPGDYSHPRGALLAARGGEQLVGCCALRPLDNVDYPNACEMKRLYVRRDVRGKGLGRLLAQAILDAARQASYSHVLLDTLTEMEAARALYEDLGFIEIPPYYFNPLEGAHYLMVKL